MTLYMMDPELEKDFLEPFIEQFDEIVENPILANLSFREDPPPGLRRTDRWSWADALYMSPPTIAMLAKATGDKRYTRFMEKAAAISERRMAAKVGLEMTVLVDHIDGATAVARTAGDAPEIDGVVNVKQAKGLKSGEFAKVRIITAGTYDLAAEPLA